MNKIKKSTKLYNKFYILYYEELLPTTTNKKKIILLYHTHTGKYWSVVNVHDFVVWG